MIIAELKRIISRCPDDMEVVVSAVSLGKVLQLIDGGDLMYFVPKTGELYLEGKNAEKDGKVYQGALVLWGVSVENDGDFGI